MRHPTIDDLGRVESGELIRRHLREVCTTCDRTFREFERQRLKRSRNREGGIPPLYRVPVSRTVQGIITGIFDSEDRQEAIRRSAARQDTDHRQVILAMLAEARKSRTLDGLQAWATLASHYALATGIGKSDALGCLTAAFLAEAARRSAQPGVAGATIRSALVGFAEGEVHDPVVQVELTFVDSKVRFESGAPIDRRLEDRLGEAAQHFAAVGDEPARGQALLFQAAAMQAGSNADPKWVPVGMVAEALSIISPTRFKPSLLHLLLEAGHGYCDKGNANAAADVILLLERLGTFREPPLTLLSLMWLLAHQAEAEGDSGAARLHYVECLSLLDEVYESFRILLEIRIGEREG